MNSNDPAYPSSPDQYSPEFGLTKRELFAAMALQGILSNQVSFTKPEESWEESDDQESDRMPAAEAAVFYADALIERLSADPVAEGLNLLPMYSRELDEGLTNE